MSKYAFLSDIHSNLEAFTVVLEKCREMGIDHFVSLGDIVGYNADPVACLKIASEMKWAGMVRGNHDVYAGAPDEDSAVDGFNAHAKQAIVWTRNHLSAAERAWLIKPPMRTNVTPPHGAPITLVHATLDSPERWGYIFDVHHASDNFSYQFTQLSLCGHSHVPVAFCKRPMTFGNEKSVLELPEWNNNFTGDAIVQPDFTQPEEMTIEVKTGHKYLFNVGSIGQPRNHDPRASFAVFDTEERTMSHIVVPYDVPATQQKIIDAGLPERLAVRLKTGS
jgi:predicted phosphodiesterase